LGRLPSAMRTLISIVIGLLVECSYDAYVQ
jgi:hypothetical protein